jgi:hypothetical protein
MKKYLTTCLLILFFSLIVAGQGQCIMPEGDRPGAPPSKEQRERLRQRIESIKIWKLTKALDLDEQSAAVLFPLLNKYDKKRAEVQHQVKEKIRDLKKNLENYNEQELNAIIANIEEHHSELQKIKDEEWIELKRVLSVEQQARLILFRIEFEREIRQIIAQKMKKQGERNRRDRDRFE